MARNCKICSLDGNLLNVINDMIKKQTADKQIVLYLEQQKDFEISITSVARHRKNCLGVKFENNVMPFNDTMASEDGDNRLDIEKVLNDAKTDLESTSLLDRINDDIDLSLIMLSDITRNQLAILKISQDRYIKGSGVYPKEQFRDLSTIMALRERFTIYKRIEQGNTTHHTEKTNGVIYNDKEEFDFDLQLDPLEIQRSLERLRSEEKEKVV